jgi:transmembrane sensor
MTDADRRALREAAAWHTRLRDHAVAPDDHGAWEAWHAADPAHQRAWHKVQAVGARMGRIPAPLAMQALAARPQRRAALRSIALGLGIGSTALLSWRMLPWAEWQATHHTATGERRELSLPDGSALSLDTATSVDVAFDADERLLKLVAGRIGVATQPDPQGRPFSVQTPQGRVLALGTRFTVQVSAGGGTRVAVQEKAVRVLPLHGEPRELNAGEQTTFSAQGAEAPEPAELSSVSWKDGGLIAIDMPLGRLIDELSRYRHGHLACAPDVAALRVSGAFPIDDTERALAALVTSFPVQVRYRTRFWVDVEAR